MAPCASSPFGEALIGHLKRQKDQQHSIRKLLSVPWDESPFAVGNPASGEFSSPDNLGRQWSMLAQAMNWKETRGERVRSHDLRHTFATLAIADHVMDVMSLSRIVGHRDASMTLNVYADALEESKRFGMDALDGTLGLSDAPEGETVPPQRRRARHMRAS